MFRKDDDLEAFVRIMGEAGIRVPIRIVAYCLMPNHFHDSFSNYLFIGGE